MLSNKSIIKNRVGFMQGRLVPSEKKRRIQYFPEKNWKKEILLAKKNNYKVMEWTINIENIKKNPVFIKSEINELKKYLKQNELKVESVTCDFFMQRPFFKNRNDKMILKFLKKIIINGQNLGIKYFVIPLVDQSSVKNKKQESLVIKNLKKFENILKKNSKIVFEIDYSPAKIIEFIKKFKSSKFRINYDTGNSAGLGYNFNLEKKYFKYVSNIHLKDKKIKSQSIRLGKGSFNFKLFLKFIKKIKYKGNFILQTARSENNRHEYELNLNRKYIEKFL